MGRTVPTVREAIEEELEWWREFKEALRKDERQAFERIVEGCKKHLSAISQAKRTEPFQPLVMTVLLDRYHGFAQRRGQNHERVMILDLAKHVQLILPLLKLALYRSRKPNQHFHNN